MSGDCAVPIEYGALRDSLARAGAILALPELHGGICGALCASGPAAAETWIDEGLAEDGAKSAASDVRSSLHDLVATSWEDLSSAALEFEPLLPDEDAPLEEQVEAIAGWCHGFLGGLGFAAPDLGMPLGTAPDGSPLAADDTALAGPSASRAHSGANGSGAGGDDAAAVHLEEICADFVEISRAGLTEDDEADRDRADFALAELREYVRVSVQIAFEALAARRALASPRDLH